jgi:hypothetical protein
MLDSNTKKLLETCQDEAWCKKWTAFLRVSQYAGGIVMVFSLIFLDGSFFGYEVPVDQDLLVILLLVGMSALFWGYYERKMIEVVRAIKDIK